MAARIGILGTFVILFLVLEVYTYFGLRSLFKSESNVRIFNIIYLLQSIFVLYALYQVYHGLSQGEVFRTTRLNVLIGIVFTTFVTKVVFGGLMMVQDVGRLLTYLFQTIVGFFANTDSSLTANGFPGRRNFLTGLATGIAAIPFFSMFYGITKGKYNYTIKRVKLAFKDLPPSFDGLKVVQISDIHAGSLDSPAQVERGVEMVNDLNPDIICFTGDLVNEDKDEVNPFLEIFQKLKAPLGKFAVLGNHDYYGVPRQGNQSAYWSDFYDKYEFMGFKLLNNEAVEIQNGSDTVTVAGVENWGAGRWFPKRGDLNKAVKNLSDDAFTLLLSHDPTHWEEHVIKHPKKVHLTMSGHTHGMQFGLNLPGFKWSPVQYRYKHWIGLAEEKGEYLYVNPGFGYLGFPGRVGIWPEITIFELQSA